MLGLFPKLHEPGGTALIREGCLPGHKRGHFRIPQTGHRANRGRGSSRGTDEIHERSDPRVLRCVNVGHPQGSFTTHESSIGVFAGIHSVAVR